jgi:hypothetical protein
MNYLHSLERWDRGFKSHYRHGCLCAFVLCSCCSACGQRPLGGPIPGQGVLCKRLRNWGGGRGTANGCRAIDRQTDRQTGRWIHRYAAPQLKRLVAGFPSLWPGFDPGSGEVGFVVDKWRSGRFSPSTSVSPASLHSTNCSRITFHKADPAFQRSIPIHQLQFHWYENSIMLIFNNWKKKSTRSSVLSGNRWSNCTFSDGPNYTNN